MLPNPEGCKPRHEPSRSAKTPEEFARAYSIRPAPNRLAPNEGNLFKKAAMMMEIIRRMLGGPKNDNK
jgi:hypothetical protein